MSFVAPFGILVLYALGALGCTCVISLSLIATPLRERWDATFAARPMLRKLIVCPMCTGFWVGLAWFLALALRCRLGWLGLVLDDLAFGFAVSFFGLLVADLEAVVAAFTKR